MGQIQFFLIKKDKDWTSRTLATQISQRDAIINFLTNQLLQRQPHKSHINQKSMTLITNIEIKSNDLHTVKKCKDAEITVEPENQDDEEIKVVAGVC